MTAPCALALLPGLFATTDALPKSGASFSLSALVIAVVLLALGGLMIFINTKGRGE